MVQAAVSAQWQACGVPKLCCYLEQADSTGASCLSVSLDFLLSEMLLSLLEHSRVEGDPSTASTPVMDPDSNITSATTITKALDLPYKLCSTPQKAAATKEIRILSHVIYFYRAICPDLL